MIVDYVHCQRIWRCKKAIPEPGGESVKIESYSCVAFEITLGTPTHASVLILSYLGVYGLHQAISIAFLPPSCFRIAFWSFIQFTLQRSSRDLLVWLFATLSFAAVYKCICIRAGKRRPIRAIR